MRDEHGESVKRYRSLLVDLLLAAAVLAFTIPTTAIGHSYALWGDPPDWLSHLVGAITAATMLVRRRTPWPMIIASAVCACVTAQTVPLILAAFSMTSEHRMRSWKIVALVLTAVYAVADYVDPYTDETLYLSVVRALTLVYLPALVGTWVCKYRGLVGELRAGVREREEFAASEERRRLARELHDTVTHAVTGMVLNAGIIRDVEDPAEIPELAAGIEDKGVQALAELRQLLTVLRRDEVPAARGADAIARLVRDAEAAGLRVDLHLDLPEDGLSPRVKHACYRLVQEGLSNVRKHAPGALVQVSCVLDGGQVCVRVDNTAGEGYHTHTMARRAASAGGGYGLDGLRERVTLAGGRLTAGPTPDGGFAIAARLPLSADDRSVE
ncbi:histidine kinase [Sphaerisporangium sp. NPDC051017]|uniref:sensor histidine kinase n=1 Tax=Sphaerisporangium sp. NPDC051017 TaxID=3154636 RepID=UPI0034198476